MRRGVLPLHAALFRPDAAATAVPLCSQLLALGATPLAAAVAASATAAADDDSDAEHPAETVIDLAMRLRLWDVAALFIMSGKAGTVISSALVDGGAGGSATLAAAAATPSAAAALARVAAAAAALIDAASAGRASVVADMLLQADGDVLAHQISPPSTSASSSSTTELSSSSSSLSSSSAAEAALPTLPPSPPVTPLHSIFTMTLDLQDNVANISSNLTSAMRKLSRTQHRLRPI
jgi:hypothetical protein